MFYKTSILANNFAHAFAILFVPLHPISKEVNNNGESLEPRG